MSEADPLQNENGVAPPTDGRFASIENIIAFDPGGRNVFGLMIPDQLRQAAQSLASATRVGIVSGFFLPDAGTSETDGPPGAVALGNALRALGMRVDYVTDERNQPAFCALGVEPVAHPERYLEHAEPTHLVSVERLGRTSDGRYRNMRGEDVTCWHAPLDGLFIQAAKRGVITIGIGDGGNEIGMGAVFAEVLATVQHGDRIACVVSTDYCIAAGTSNWGAYGLVAALSVNCGRELLPAADEIAHALGAVVRSGAAVDGITHRAEPTVDGIPLATTFRLVENLRRQITPSPLRRGTSLRVGVLGYGETGRAAARLLARRGHQVRVSDCGEVDVSPGDAIHGLETGGHTITFLEACDFIVASPGVRPDAPIRDELHRRGIPVMSELELASQLCDRPIIAVTGTVGKRNTIELIQTMFERAGRALTIGGNKGRPLSAMLLDDDQSGPIALAVSSFQLETVVHFNPRIAVILNIDEAHMDRHRSLAEYVRIKSRVFMNHTGGRDSPSNDDPLPCGDTLILPFDDVRLRSLGRKHRGRTLLMSSREPVDRGAWIEAGALRLRRDDDVHAWNWPAPNDQGTSGVFIEDVLSAVLVARLAGLDHTAIETALKEQTWK